MSRLSDRLEWILSYETDGGEKIEVLTDRLSNLEKKGRNVNEMTEQSRENFKDLHGKTELYSVETERLAQKQMEMATSLSDTNEVVRDVTLGLENFRFEFETGNITRDEYIEGLGVLRMQLEGIDNQTLSSVRALRTIANEQTKFGAETNQVTGNVRQNMMAMNALSRTLTTLPRGIEGVSSQLPFLAQNLSRVSSSSGGVMAGLKGMVGFLTGPTGIVLAISTLIPLVIGLVSHLGKMRKETLDLDEVSKNYVSTLDELIANVLELRGLTGGGVFDTDALNENLRLTTQAREEQEKILEALELEKVELAIALSQGRVNVAQSERYRIIRDQIKVLQENVNSALETERSLKGEILSLELLSNNETARSLSFEQARLEAIEASKKQLEKMREEQERMNEITQGIFKADAIRDLEEFHQGRVEAEQRILESLERQLQLIRQKAIEERLSQQMLLSPPDVPGQADDESVDINRAMISQQLAEQARLAMIRDSVTEEQFIRRSMELDFQRERNDLLAQGITDQESLNNLRILQEQELQDRMNQINRESADARWAMWESLAGNLQGLGEIIAGSNEKNAKKAFEINKALALASAIAFAPRAIIRAFGDGGIKAGIFMIAQTALQIAKIASTQFRGGGRGGSRGNANQTFSFRGVDSESIQGAGIQQQQVQVPDKLKLLDSSGKLLTEMEYARSQSGENLYLTDD